jgi:PKD repeat protein
MKAMQKFTFLLYTLVVLITVGAAATESQLLNQNQIMSSDSIDCQAAFAFEVDDETLTVSFFDQSTGNNLEYLWGFGDGETSSEANPVYTYSQPGVYTVILTIFSQDPECVSVATAQIEVGEIPCTAMFDYYEVDFTVYFGDESQGNPTAWFWDFGDGNTSTLQNPSHTYSDFGPFDVLLAISGNDNCADTIVQTIFFDTINCSAFWGFTMDDLTITFENLSVGQDLEYFWDFGDGMTSAEESPVHTYSEPGIYGICLLISSSTNGCESSFCLDIEVGDIPCEADFDYFVLGDSLGINSVYFTNLSTGNFTETFWDFGDGNTSTQYSPFHTYDDEGEYEVCLTISDPGNPDCEDQYCATVFIDSIPCSADFSYIINGLTVEFTNLSTGSDPYMYWYFGDGSNSYETDPVHTYESAGYYAVCLAIYDEIQFCYDFYCTQIVVGDPQCEADFSYFQSGENTLQFINQSNVPADSLVWDFGDGTTSGEFNPEHIYDELGVYTVCLTIFNESLDCSDQFCQEVIVDELDCSSDFTFEIDELTVSFMPEFEGDSVLYMWDFGDGNASDMQSPVHTYEVGGMYDVCLVVLDPFSGCSSVSCEMVLVGEGQNLSFASWFTYEFETESEVQFLDGSIGNAVNYFWDFGDGTTSGMQHPTHTFNQNGIHTVCLTVSDMFTGETSTFCRDIEIETLTGVDFQLHAGKQINIYPNPSSTVLNISCAGCALGSTLQIFNLNGQKVLEFTLNQQNESINIRGLDKGVYLIKLLGDDSVSTQRLIKQ